MSGICSSCLAFAQELHFKSWTVFISRTDDLRTAGKLMGEDKYGNKYYENNEFFIGELNCTGLSK
jgi:hypothetical protein